MSARTKQYDGGLEMNTLHQKAASRYIMDREKVRGKQNTEKGSIFIFIKENYYYYHHRHHDCWLENDNVGVIKDNLLNYTNATFRTRDKSSNENLFNKNLIRVSNTAHYNLM